MLTGLNVILLLFSNDVFNVPFKINAFICFLYESISSALKALIREFHKYHYKMEYPSGYITLYDNIIPQYIEHNLSQNGLSDKEGLTKFSTTLSYF